MNPWCLMAAWERYWNEVFWAATMFRARMYAPCIQERRG